MASSGPGGAQQRRRAGPSWGKGRGTFIKGSGDGGGRGAAQKKAEPGRMHVQRKSVQSGEKDKKRWKSAQQINAGSAKEGECHSVPRAPNWPSFGSKSFFPHLSRSI